MSTVFFRNAFVAKSDFSLDFHNRAFRYGDGCFETIRVVNGIPVFWSIHYARLTSSLAYLAIDFGKKESQLCQNIAQLISQNNIRNGLLRIQVYREGGGKYFPESNQGCLLMECIEDKRFLYLDPVLEKEAFLFKRILLPKHEFGNHKAINKSIQIAAAVEAQKREIGEALLFNSDGNVVEAVSSNLFILNKSNLRTPSLSEGCLAGVMRSVILDGALENQWNVEEGEISVNELLGSDEIWTTNAASGISTIRKIGTKTFGSKAAERAQGLLGQVALNSCSDFQGTLT